MFSPTRFFATCPKGVEDLLAQELTALGAESVEPGRAGAGFGGTLETAYRACLWSRVASRVLLPLAQAPAADAEALYAVVHAIAWEEHFTPHETFAVDFTTTQSTLTHSHFGALKVKDAIVDRLREQLGERPSVDTRAPDIRVNVYLFRDVATVSLDLAGEALHRRGYRTEAVEAPLKENLAAAILLRARWPAVAKDGGALVDLMCGSGTFLIEAALLAADSAPGLQRVAYGFLKWRQHDTALWQRLLDEAYARRTAGLETLPPIHGYDRNVRAIGIARANVERAGLADNILVTQRALKDCEPETVATGLVLVNPPYGERLGEQEELTALYAELGAQLKRCFGGWKAAVFTGNADLAGVLRLSPERTHTLYNGALECKLLHFAITTAAERSARAARVFEIVPGSGAEMFANRLRKDLRHYGRWARKQEIFAWRLYDADMHEYNLAIDIYDCEKRFVHVQEYEAPDTIEPNLASARLKEALQVIPLVLEIPREQLFFKVRRRQRGGSQYEKQDERGEFHAVREGPCRLLVNFTDYLDTGLFLDHRDTRALVGTLAKDKRFLNLFGYTGTATVHAALAGARATTTVDMSNTYLDWAQRNFELNGMRATNHELIQADVLKWLSAERGRQYDLIFLDPPTFSRSKRMDDTLDIQRDHVDLLRATAALLAPDGTLIFSTNLRKFKLDRDALPELHIEDITRRTIPEDFKRNPKIHHCFRIRHTGNPN